MQSIDKNSPVDPEVMFKLSYGLFVLSARENEKDNGCITNTVTQITSTPLQISVAVNKANYTHGMIQRTGEFVLSVLSESATFEVFQRFGFQSGKESNKFTTSCERAANGICYISEHTNGVIAAKVTDSKDMGTHTVFFAEVTQSFVLSNERSATYQYYFDHIKPKPQPPKEKGFVCKICGYVYEGETLPEDFICPICKHGASDFEKINTRRSQDDYTDKGHGTGCSENR